VTTAVIVAVRGALEADIASALSAHPELVVARRCADLVEAVAAASAGVGGVVVLSDQPRLDRSVIRSLSRRGVGVVGVPTEPDAAATLLALGVATVVPFGAKPGEVVEAVLDTINERVPVPEVDVVEDREAVAGAIVAVWGPTGAPGRTTLAVNLAAEVATLAGGAILVDLDTYGGAVAQALGLLDEAPGVAAVARAALQGGSVEDVIERHALGVRPGLRVLTGISRASRWAELPVAALEPMWAALRAATPVTVVDCGFGIEANAGVTVGPGRDDATRSALAAASVILVVGSAEPLGVQRLVQALADLGEVEGVGDQARIVVVNRVRASVAGAKPGEAVADVLARYASVSEAWMVPEDQKACDAATLAGQTLMERAPHSPARRAIEAIAGHVWGVVSGIPSEVTVRGKG
jgi:MinD-like ATPase involved in chromosome partitioning or flagellar assembly